MNTETFQNLVSLAEKRTKLSLDESFSLANECSRLLGNSEEDKGRELVIRALENASRFPKETERLWDDLVDAAGLYPYLRPTSGSGSTLLRHEYHASPYLP